MLYVEKHIEANEIIGRYGLTVFRKVASGYRQPVKEGYLEPIISYYKRRANFSYVIMERVN